MQDHVVHARFRKIAASPYSFSNIRKMEPLLDKHIERWTSRLDAFASSGTKMDFAPWAVYLAYDIVSEVGFGQPFGFIEQGNDVEGLIQGFHDGLVPFIEARDEYGNPLDLNYIKAEILLVLLAGADTTGTAFQAFMIHIMTHPEVYDRLMNEIDAQTRAGNLSEMPQYTEVQEHCPFYIACIREAMRLNPSAPNIFPRLAGKGGMELYGKHVPEGAEVTCNPWLVHRDENIFGPDASDFRPERWLESEEKTKEMLKYNMGFGYGARVCLGKDLAMMELFKGPLQFFRTFKPEILNKREPGKYVVKGGVSFFKDMWINIERRPKPM
ncbi:hypothetical protein COL516b_000028 [Colletotrichum fioriniae]|nr:uncharacterized protein COL516b_000028 [Colletotrichum fioriniae]KAJ0313103.1 hypothetical protein COL516b_000028 [Colletotrichum fioriniae]